MYLEIDPQKYCEEGEISIIGEPKTFVQVVGESAKKKQGWFSITREEYLCKSYKNIRGKMGVLFAHMIRVRDSNNQVIYDSKEMAKQTKLSQHMVIDSIKYFEQKGMVKRRGNTVMINPGIVHQGDRSREAVLMKIYEKM